MLVVGVCQTPEIMGDVRAALDIVHEYAGRADLLVFPECFLQGYRPTADHVRRYAMSCADVRLDVPGIVVLGMIERAGNRYYNTAAVFDGGRVVGAYRKTFLTRGERVFTAGDAYPVFETAGMRFGVNICFDGQFPHAAAAVARQGATLLAFPAQNMMRRENAYGWAGKHNELRRKRIAETGLWLASADVTGERGDTHLGLGPTCVMNPAGEIVAEVPRGTVGVATAEVC
ncbi:carbon-nitrogen hydrolase family protein [Paractinoplanes lichenicola]|uniref:Carbon-nitrogen hydrolase family protein n=1 Tax=Paractinoplanes lichenicola TaxID=2802976 RepID=A0ABS1VX07_9ACTN|nr:carbon-nitrogen hydrolase family protein [Actinoplanes lichenicola]MBL7259000.1 carbon-nitrogen hydrolase family protein [Actinoplanes lichenicola]